LGGVGQNFPNDEKKFRIFLGIRSHEDVRYPENEDAIYKQNKHILRTDILKQHAVRYEAVLDSRAENEG
jgi:hypothetical protein